MRSDFRPHALTRPRRPARDERPAREACVQRLGLDAKRPETLPFLGDDATAGTETELQVAVLGRAQDVDLPRYIADSRYLANVRQQVGTGEATARRLRDLEAYLDDNADQVWENSWVRFSPEHLGPLARQVLDEDMLGDRQQPQGPKRSDIDRFWCREADGDHLRIPISYLLRLSLADVAGTFDDPSVQSRALALLPHLMDDNISPETSSLHIVPIRAKTRNGRELAKETARRFLLTHLLVEWANEKFHLRRTGQTAALFFSPHPPVRQKLLNDQISDAFYRHLFISPCLAWDAGESKHRYMRLCHQVLSRSHLNAIGKLREAGIIAHNLVVLPTVSNISLSNNGTHINLGSRRLGEHLSDPASGFGAAHEKSLGDLVIKVFEHFLPLFVGTYSAAPYRLDFADFHPERALGFLAHELHDRHLRMMWRRWKKKAKNSVFGNPLTPFGPPWLDRAVSGSLGLRGDYVPDFRLIDYPVAWLGTGQSSALDGTLGNTQRLTADLDALGIFDQQMSLYLPLKLRQREALGFSGFEGRHYSLFPSLSKDLAGATDLQMLLLAFSLMLVADGDVDHGLIPDDPETESERRQIFFGAAIDLPTFFVRQNTPNQFLRSLVERAPDVRRSHRYRGFYRVTQRGFRLALLQLLEEKAAPLVEFQGLGELLGDLRHRLESSDGSAAQRLHREILDEAGGRDPRGRRPGSPFAMPATEFNQAAEACYRQTVRQRHLEEAIDFLAEDVVERRLDIDSGWITRQTSRLVHGGASPEALRQWIALLLRTLPECATGSGTEDTLREAS